MMDRVLKLSRCCVLFTGIALLGGCASAPPRNADDICEVFREKRDWHKASRKAEQRWGTPVHIPMAIMYQESGYRAKARPPMRYFLGFIPRGRSSSAFGYAQAQTPAWSDYQRESGNDWSSRDNFADAVDFVQWYIDKSHRINGVAKTDVHAQYLNYHEGWGGYRRGSYRAKPALDQTARRVEQRAARYAAQYASCRDELERGWLRRLFS